jgi:dolichyl-diphosphooligosaccharide--protein glycosyltransferase
LALVVALLWPTGYFGPLSSRIRSLFLEHTRTGNPLVDSVAEHQPARAEAYEQYLHKARFLAPIGALFSLIRRTDASLFVVAWCFTTYMFSTKMARLIVLLGAPVSVASGMCIGLIVDWAIAQLTMCCGKRAPIIEEIAPKVEEADKTEDKKEDKKDKKDKKTKKGKAKSYDADEAIAVLIEFATNSVFNPAKTIANEKYNFLPMRLLRIVAALGVFVVILYPNDLSTYTKKIPKNMLPDQKNLIKSLKKALPKELTFQGEKISGFAEDFYAYSHQLAHQMSNPSVMFKGKLQNGQEIMVDDYREAYFWLRDNTPEDSRILAWWDYGYQIAGMANRTTIADGNTWNHEHIATLGRSLVSSEVKAHKIIRHWADYVLIWAGGGGDDLAKSPHMARIGTSVYKDICPNDPTCQYFGFVAQGKPTPMMEQSLLYKLHGHGRITKVSEKRFKDVYQSKYGKVRIFKVMNISETSKEWVKDPANRVCDAPGSWYCTGQYPPAMQKMFKKWGRKDFAQLEDWNKARDEDADTHYKSYME